MRRLFFTTLLIVLTFTLNAQGMRTPSASPNPCRPKLVNKVILTDDDDSLDDQDDQQAQGAPLLFAEAASPVLVLAPPPAVAPGFPPAFDLPPYAAVLDPNSPSRASPVSLS